MTAHALAHARAAADELLARKVYEGMTPEVAMNMATAGFTVTTRTLADLRRDGLSEDQITDAFRAKLVQARDAGDVKGETAAEFALAVWSGMQADLAAYLRAS